MREEAHVSPSLPPILASLVASLPATLRGPDTTVPDSDAAWRAHRRLARELGNLGWLSEHWPRECGGRSATAEAVASWRETLGLMGIPAGHALVSGVRWIAGPLLAHGTHEQQARWLPEVARGERTCALAVTEEQAGSDLGAITCSATPTPRGYCLEGEKARVSFGHRVDTHLVLARTERVMHGVGGLSLFLVPARLRGISISKRPTLGPGHPLVRLQFERVTIPKEARIGEPGQGFEVLHDSRWSGDTPVDRAAVFLHALRMLARENMEPGAGYEALAEEGRRWHRMAWHAVRNPGDRDLERWWDRSQEARRWVQLGLAHAAIGQGARAQALWSHANTMHAGTPVEGLQRMASLGRHGLWESLRR